MEFRILEQLNEIKSLILDKSGDKWLNIKDVCKYASISESTIRRAVKRGTLKSSNATGRLLFKVSSIDKWLKG